jgi:ParB-like chromosome segregation protein Spo0J
VQTLIESQGLSQREAAQRLGKPLVYVSELMSILKIEPPRLKRAKDLPKRALVEIGRAETPEDQERLLTAALAVKNPVAELTRAKAERKEAKHERRAEPIFKAHYGLGDTTLTLTIDKDPEKVTHKYLVKLLQRLIETLRTEEGQRGKAPPKR